MPRRLLILSDEEIHDLSMGKVIPCNIEGVKFEIMSSMRFLTETEKEKQNDHIES